MKYSLLLDIMEGGRFLCQMRYTRPPWPKIIDGETVLAYEYKDLEKFVYSQKPSLRNRKGISILPTNQKVIKK